MRSPALRARGVGAAWSASPNATTLTRKTTMLVAAAQRSRIARRAEPHGNGAGLSRRDVCAKETGKRTWPNAKQITERQDSRKPKPEHAMTRASQDSRKRKATWGWGVNDERGARSAFFVSTVLVCDQQRSMANTRVVNPTKTCAALRALACAHWIQNYACLGSKNNQDTKSNQNKSRKSSLRSH